MSVNFFKSNNPRVKQAIWDNFWYEGVQKKKNITKKKIESSLKDVERMQEKWRSLSPKARRFGLNRGLGARYRQKISQLKCLLRNVK